MEVAAAHPEVDLWITAAHPPDKADLPLPGTKETNTITTALATMAATRATVVATEAEALAVEAGAIPTPGTVPVVAMAEAATMAPSIPAGTTIQVVALAAMAEAPETGIEVGVRTLAGTTTIVTEEDKEEVMEVTVQEEVIRVIEEDKVKQAVRCAEVPTEATEVEDAPRPIL